MSNPPTVLITRPENAARRFEGALRAAALDVPILIAPVLEIVEIAGALEGSTLAPEDARAVIFTSVHAVAAFVAQSCARPQAWCVGKATAGVARDAGFTAFAAAGHADDLFRLIVAAGTAGPFLHPRGRVARGALAERLGLAGLPTTEVVIYDQIARDIGAKARALLTGAAPVVVPLFSPRSAALLREAAGAATAPLHLVAISQAAATEWAAGGPHAAEKTLRIAQRPDMGAMVSAVIAGLHAAREP